MGKNTTGMMGKTNKISVLSPVRASSVTVWKYLVSLVLVKVKVVFSILNN